MGSKTFKGGVHPYEGKELAKDQPIVEVLPKGDLVYPLSQHIGAPASPVVAVGDKVLKGQKIAEAGGFVSSPIYASASGTVKAIEPRRVAVGDMVNSIVIENDGAFEEVEYTPCDVVLARRMWSCLLRNRKRLSMSLQTARSVSRILRRITEECWKIRRN